MLITPIHSRRAPDHGDTLVGLRLRDRLERGTAIGCSLAEELAGNAARFVCCLVEEQPPRLIGGEGFAGIRAEWLTDLTAAASARRYKACEQFDATLDPVASLLALPAFDSEWEVRAAALQALLGAGSRLSLDRRLLGAVAYLIGDDHSVVRDSAFSLVAAQPEPVELMTQLLAERRRRDVRPLVHSLRLTRFASRLPDGLAGLHLATEAPELLSHPEASVRGAVLEALLWSEVRVDRGRVTPLTNDPVVEVADLAAQLLDEWADSPAEGTK